MSVPPDRARDEDVVSTDELVRQRGVAPLRSVEDTAHEDAWCSFGGMIGRGLRDDCDGSLIGSPSTPEARWEASVAT